MCVDVAIVNLTRLGDLLQTQPLITDLHASGYTVGLVCLENFSPAASMLEHVSEIYAFPGASIMAALEHNWGKAAESFLNFAARVKLNTNSYVLNLTPSLPARILTRQIAAKGAKMLGFGLDEYGFGVNEGVWASFFAVAAEKRINSPFNVADMMRNLALPLLKSGSGDFLLASPPDDALAFADDFTKTLEAGQKGYVAIQLGASEERRRWPVASFRELGQEIWEKSGYAPILLGGVNEIALGEEYAREARHPFLNAIGKTSLTQLAGLLRKCAILVTNDTGTMHLASGQNVPSLAIFLATAQPCDTGPLRDDCCCLEPALACHPCAFGKICPEEEKCRKVITPGLAARLALGKLEHGDWLANPEVKENTGSRIWLTGHDQAGFATVRCVSGHKSEDRSLWLQWLRLFWSQLLDNISRNNQVTAKDDMYSHLAKPSFANVCARELEQGAAVLDSLLACGQLAHKSKQASELILRNCERFQNVLDNRGPLASLAAFWREYRHSQCDSLENFLPAVTILAAHLRQLASALKS